MTMTDVQDVIVTAPRAVVPLPLGILPSDLVSIVGSLFSMLGCWREIHLLWWREFLWGVDPPAKRI